MAVGRGNCDGVGCGGDVVEGVLVVEGEAGSTTLLGAIGES